MPSQTLSFEDFGIHKTFGFLPMDPPPLRRLLDVYYAPWENTMDDLQSLCLIGKLRSTVKKLPVLETNRLITLREKERAYLVLSFIAHAYIWGYPKIEGVDTVTVPWVAVSKSLGRKPVISYGATVLYNFRLIVPEGSCDLSNLAMINTFTGCMDEAWFYLISLAIEAAGAPAVPAILNAHNLISSSKYLMDQPQLATAEELYQLAKYLSTIRAAIDDMTPILLRMYERNDPHFFYNRTRWFQSGWKGMDDVMPEGVFYEGVTEVDECVVRSESNGTWRIYAGASAGQSPLIHTLDVALGVEHKTMKFLKPTEEEPTTLYSHSPHNITNGIEKSTISRPSTPQDHTPNPMHEMRDYLSTDHRNFLESLTRGPSIRQLINQLAVINKTSLRIPPDVYRARTEAITQFNKSIEGLKRFRDKHLQLVAVYIILQGKKTRPTKSIKESTSNIVNVDNAPGSGMTAHSPRLAVAESTSPLLSPFPSLPVSFPSLDSFAGITSNGSLKTSFALNGVSTPSSVFEHVNGTNVNGVEEHAKKSMKGTGGTDLLPFLRQVRSETVDAFVED
ncbi:hypothetical protein HK098_002709 [Nowakowskiella sp. JEL0407]|nr:hypothetical protein HK098_002709 [Nowakowskiella sp. JEL0407]